MFDEEKNLEAGKTEPKAETSKTAAENSKTDAQSAKPGDDKIKELQAKIKELEAEAGSMAQMSELQPGLKTVSDNESVIQDVAQTEAEKKYQTLFGDRRRTSKKLPKRISLYIALGLVAVLIVVLALSIPSFYNVKMPSKAENLKNFAEIYEYAEWEATGGYYATLNGGLADVVNSGQSNVIVDPDEGLFANIFCYEFSSAAKAEEYLKQTAAQNGVTPSLVNFLYSMGSCAYQAPNFYYESWFCGKMLVEVCATDAATANLMRTRITQAS